MLLVTNGNMVAMVLSGIWLTAVIKAPITHSQLLFRALHLWNLAWPKADSSICMVFSPPNGLFCIDFLEIKRNQLEKLSTYGNYEHSSDLFIPKFVILREILG